ncbi:N-terminal C2 in EEIG1 and EHBP1 proteins-domain-containing protein [Thelephora terrestris]|uniref:N-terminal C2 in EEIG1 and EHBP1 proteins-domain-containing protein n=1 Tax=Thelephora terrestris TaxID=56493 RepID=A0A9P6H7F4_9AGAM|nr:N-terminal C2 in EEIG1 and EHBP1 proteins-domain-containing protein [Thelephora terrestris]
MPSRSRVSSRPSTPSEYSSSTSQTHSAGPSFRSHLFNILPKHALFKVKLHIRQISNVPFLGGDFAVRWRFRNVQSPGGNHSGLLSKMKANSSSATMTLKGKSKDYFLDGEDSPITQSAYPWSTNGAAGRDTPDPGNSHDHPSTAGTKSSSSSFLFASPSGTPSLTPATHGMHSDGRGMTPWTELSDHTATWDHHVALIIRMDVDRETLDLHSSELKLTVLQKTDPGEQYQPQRPRFGVVYLNLAEYVDVGPITRRHLLRESKTNATLQLTIDLEHVGGEVNYKAPPLQKGEILAQVTGLLANPGFHRARFLRELEFIEDPDNDPEERYNLKQHFPSFDGLASSGGIRETEFLIETLFNPIPSHTITPFTRDVPSTPTEQPSIESDRTSVEPAPSLISSECSASSSTRASDKSRPWWRGGRVPSNKSVASSTS